MTVSWLDLVAIRIVFFNTQNIYYSALYSNLCKLVLQFIKTFKPMYSSAIISIKETYNFKGVFDNNKKTGYF